MSGGHPHWGFLRKGTEPEDTGINCSWLICSWLRTYWETVNEIKSHRLWIESCEKYKKYLVEVYRKPLPHKRWWTSNAGITRAALIRLLIGRLIYLIYGKNVFLSRKIQNYLKHSRGIPRRTSDVERRIFEMFSKLFVKLSRCSSTILSDYLRESLF